MSVNTSYTIQMASKISGVGVHTIRAWEKRYKALEPSRDSSGHRTYTKTDIEKLILLSELCLLGYTISKVAKHSSAELKMLLIDLGKSEASIESPEFNLIKEKAPVDTTHSMSILIFALKAYKMDVILQELGKYKNSLMAREMALSLLKPMALELKNLVSQGSLSSEKEQVVMALLRFYAGDLLYQTTERRERVSINVLVAGMEGGNCDLETIMAGLIANHYGFNYSFYGANNSLEVLCESLSFLKTHLLVLNVTKAFVQFGKVFVQSFVEKIISQSQPSLEIILLGNLDLEFVRIPTKRVHIVKSIESLDELLQYKTVSL